MPKICEQFEKCKQWYDCHKYFATISGVVVAMFHANGVEVIGTNPHWSFP